jgi:FMN phosphatase YigB (HAD superfamily)
VAEPRLLLVVDLDGTLLRGDQPVLDYAEAASAGLDATERDSLRGALHAYLREGVASAARHPADADALAGALDGWDVVARLAARRGVARKDLDRAFLSARESLARPDYPVEVPAAFAEVLRGLAGQVRRLLVTNSPPAGLAVVFGRFAVGPLFDEVVPSAKKPEGLRELLPRELERIGATEAPWRACGVGDLWRNDLEPAAALGAATLYIDRFGRRDGVADASATTIEALLPALRRWVDEPEAFSKTRQRVSKEGN